MAGLLYSHVSVDLVEQLCEHFSGFNLINVDTSGFNHDMLLDDALVRCKARILVLQNTNLVNTLHVQAENRPPEVLNMNSMSCVLRGKLLLSELYEEVYNAESNLGGSAGRRFSVFVLRTESRDLDLNEHTHASGRLFANF